MAADVGADRAGGVPFSSDHARVRYFSDPEKRSLLDMPPDVTDPGFEVVVMSGLPASGKSTAAARIAKERSIPVMSLDGLRAELGIDPEDNQGAVAQAAKERAKELLRRKQSFVWDGTNLTREFRGAVLGLAHAYGARTRIVYVERPAAEVYAANRARRDPVPDAAYRRMIRRWEVPTAAECHTLEMQVEDAPAPGAQPRARKP
jgi:predicted kinase